MTKASETRVVEVVEVERSMRTLLADTLTHPPTSAQAESVARHAVERQRAGRILASSDPNHLLYKLTGEVRGLQARAVEGSGYVTHEGEAFARRATPKVRGKAARKALKRQRQQQRQRDADTADGCGCGTLGCATCYPSRGFGA